MELKTEISSEEMAAAVGVADQAVHVHQRWSQEVVRSLLCRQSPDPDDFAKDAHRSCAFGQWYYSEDNAHLRLQPGFIAIQFEHEEMHRLALRMIETTQLGLPIQASDYEMFVAALAEMRSEVLGLRARVEGGVTQLDPMTGAISRGSMLSKLEVHQEMVKRGLLSCTLALMDLDFLTAVNHAYGDDSGDRVLAQTAHHVMTHLRPYDETFRYGGEEFLLCAPGTSLEQGFNAIERLRENIAATTYELGDGQEAGLTVSFGITQLDPEVSVAESIARANRALGDAKQSGRNTTCVWEAALA